MATVSTLPWHRPKKVVKYGKSGSRSTYAPQHVDAWLEEDEAKPSRPTVTRKAPVAQTYGVGKPTAKREVKAQDKEKSPAKKGAVKSTKPREKQRDAFDVPSSDDEAGEYELRSYSPPNLSSKRTLVSAPVAAEDAQLAPWERSKAAKTRTPSDLAQGPIQTPEIPSPGQPGPAEVKYRNLDAVAIPRIPAVKSEPEPTSAAARLAARRQHATKAAASAVAEPALQPPVPAKRSGTVEKTDVPRKRARKTPPTNEGSKDIHMDDAFSVSTTCDGDGPSSHKIGSEVDIYECPADEERAVKPAQKPAPLKATGKNARRGKLVSSSSRSTPMKGSSAPARLVDMLPVDTDSTDAPSMSPSDVPSRPSTPRRSITPAPSASSPHAGAKAMTPKQAHLWSQLLTSDPLAPSPSHLAIKNLTLSSRRRAAGDAAPPKLALAKSKSDVPELHRTRTRLVDRLKAAASTSEEDSSEESDAEMEDAGPANTAGQTSQASQKTVLSEEGPSQSQTQPSASQGGVKITYARVRSYLPEDDIEAGLFSDLPPITQRPPVLARQPSRHNGASQKSAFDMDDSDDEASTGRLRTIHELRAAGRNDRFLADTQALLDDISDHNHSARSRRRSAIMELSTQLTDKAYAERFVSHGFEHKLVAEIASSPDEVADFLLMIAFATLLTAEPPAHVITVLKDGELLDWAANTLSKDVSVSKMAKDRRNNMAKAAQTSLLQSVEKMRTSQLLWDKSIPTSLNPRTVSLKLLDLHIGRLRRLDDRSDLLDGTQVQHVLGNTSETGADPTERSLVVSVLESLSAAKFTLSWPADVLGKVASILRSLVTAANPDQHTAFLAFRLTLNLTNGRAETCAAFADAAIIQGLLQAVKDGFSALNDNSNETDPEQRAISRDLLILAVGLTTNLAEHSPAARQSTVTDAAKPVLAALLSIFQKGQELLEQAESIRDTETNVAFGYLAVMLANICLDAQARVFIASKLPNRNLELLVSAVEEFLMHHQRVDSLKEDFDGAEGRAVWGTFTEKLKVVVGRLRDAAALV
jgi:hypothetical protein